MAGTVSGARHRCSEDAEHENVDDHSSLQGWLRLERPSGDGVGE